MSILSSVMFFGRDELLLQTRGRIFELAGFQVSFAEELRQVSPVVSEHSVDLIVLCHSLSSTECTAVRLIAENAGIQVLQLLITDRGVGEGHDSEMKKPAGVTFDWMRGPEALLEEVCSLLHIERRWTPSEALLAFATKPGVA